jgi:hypothetical protein
MHRRFSLLRLPSALFATAWHAGELKKKQPTWTWGKRAKTNWAFFVVCMYGGF